jgi:hypothetical protein
MRKKVTLKYNKHNANIRTRMEEIYYIWDHVSKEIARNILIKIYRGEFYEINKISDRRLILHNLICIEIEIDGITNSAKLWSKELVELLDNEPEYVEFNLEEYAKAMNNYLYTHKGELNNKELESAYEKYYKTFEKYNYEDGSKCFMEKLIAKFNLNMIKENFLEAFDALEGLLLHNNDTDYITAFEYCADELREKNEDLYNQIILLSKNNISKIS